MNKVNFKQPKYIIALLTLPFTCYFAYNVQQYTKKEEKVKKAELSTDLGSDDQIADIMDKENAYQDAYRMQRNQGTAINSLSEEQDSLNFYGNNVTSKQQRYLDSLAAVTKMEEAMRRANMNAEIARHSFNGGGNGNRSQSREDAEYEKSMKLLQALNNEPSSATRERPQSQQESPAQWRNEQMKMMREQMMLADSLEKSKDPELIKQAAAQKQMFNDRQKRDYYLNSSLRVKKYRSPDAFNSFYKENNDSFIKAVIDENVTGYMGSRVKLRLLDDITAGNFIIPKKTKLYALITGFDAQRVKLSIVSVLVGNKILPINLSVYDNDGIEGLYVPASAFREMTKEMGQNMVQGQALTSDNANFFNNMLTSVYQSASETIAEVLRKNKSKIKYDTNIYLIDKEQLNKERDAIYKQNR